MRARAISIAAALAGVSTLVAGCGFRPVYDQTGAGVGPVEITRIEGRTGYFLRDALQRRAALERSGGRARTLEVKLDTRFTPVSQGSDAIGTRSQMAVYAFYEFKEPDGTTAAKGYVETMVGYETYLEPYGDVSLQADAEERAAERLAAALWDRLRLSAPRSGR